MKKKKLLALILVFTLMLATAAVLVGCTPAAPAAPAPAAPAAEPAAPAAEAPAASADDTPAPGDGQTTLRILAGQSTTDVGIEVMITEAVAARFPEITLEWELVEWGDELNSRMMVYIQTELPDIIVGKAQDVTTYGTLDLLADLTGKPYLDGVLDAANPGVTIDGKLMGLTYNALYQGVYYNRAMFRENGWELPDTLDDLQAIIDDALAKGITPFASHMMDTWSIGNVTMQFMVNEVFRNTPDWGDRFRAGQVNYVDDDGARASYMMNQLIFENTWSAETFSMDQVACDARMVMGDAAMKVSGSWSIQNFLDVDPDFDFGIFPFPNRAGDAKLLFEPNITFMASAASPNMDAIDKFFSVLAEDKALALEIYDFTKTAPMIEGVTPTFPNPSQSDIDMFAAQGRILDVNLGNNQLQWGGFQYENAMDIAEWLLGQITLDEALEAADGRRAASRAT